MSAGIEKKLADLLDSVDRKKRRADIEKYLIEHEHALYEAERMPFIGGVTITPEDWPPISSDIYSTYDKETDKVFFYANFCTTQHFRLNTAGEYHIKVRVSLYSSYYVQGAVMYTREDDTEGSVMVSLIRLVEVDRDTMRKRTPIANSNSCYFEGFGYLNIPDGFGPCDITVRYITDEVRTSSFLKRVEFSIPRISFNAWIAVIRGQARIVDQNGCPEYVGIEMPSEIEIDASPSPSRGTKKRSM